MEDYKNRKKGMVFLQVWLYPEELQFLLTSTEGERINQLLQTIRDRGDFNGNPEVL